MIFKQKKAIMYEFLVRLIIAIVFIFGAIYIAKSFFRTTSAAEESFNNMAEMIDSVEEGMTTTMALIMDKGTAIALFNKDKEMLEFYKNIRWAEEEPPDESDTAAWRKYSMKKPQECSDHSDCMCLCKKIKIDKSGISSADISFKGELICLKYLCKDIDSKILPLYDQQDNPYGVDKTKNGVIFLREVGLMFGSKVSQPRAKTLYATRYHDFVAVCLKAPCITDEIKNKREKADADEFVHTYSLKDLIGINMYGGDELNMFYYIVDFKKDAFNNYYYEYTWGPRGVGIFSEITRTEIVNDFENKLLNYANDNKAVKVNHDHNGKDMTTFSANDELNEDGTLREI